MQHCEFLWRSRTGGVRSQGVVVRTLHRMGAQHKLDRLLFGVQHPNGRDNCDFLDAGHAGGHAFVLQRVLRFVDSFGCESAHPHGTGSLSAHRVPRKQQVTLLASVT